MLKRLTAATAAFALSVAPVAASAQSQAAAEVAPAQEEVDGEQIRGGFILPLAVIVAIIIGVLLLTKDDEEPISP